MRRRGYVEPPMREPELRARWYRDEAHYWADRAQRSATAAMVLAGVAIVFALVALANGAHP